MREVLRSIWVWTATVALVLLWLPLLTAIRLFDRDAMHYRTARWFRRLGVAVTKINPAWRLHLSGNNISKPGPPYVVVSNHQSLADIPLVAHLPLDMKWMAKVEVFKYPIFGWMCRMAGDIPVDRKDRRKGLKALHQASRYLQKKCSVMFFPEGTRSPDGRVHQFHDGAFHLAIREQIPVLPIAVEGSRSCLPKNSWIFGKPQEIFIKVLPPVETTGLTSKDVLSLRDKVRRMIIEQVAEWRGVEPDRL